jgi:hypothetical protein
MKSIIGILAAMGAGAALMYLFDPNGGNRRRALIRDKAVGLSNDIRDTVDKRTRDLGNRAKGLMHEAKAALPGTGTGQSEQAERLA